MASPRAREPRAEVGVTGIHLLEERPRPWSWVLPPLQLREGPQGAGTQGRGSHSAGADASEAWRIDQAEQELGPLRRGSRGGTGGAGRSRKLEPTTNIWNWNQLPHLACGAVAGEMLANSKQSPSGPPACQSHSGVPSQQDPVETRWRERVCRLLALGSQSSI